MSPSSPHRRRVSASHLFLAFAVLSVQSFGGVLFWMRRLIVERRRWLTEQEFVELVGLAQLLPGVNGINLAVLIGFRFAGWVGAAGAFAGFLAPPCLVVVVLGALHQRYGALLLVQDALGGMAAVAVGLLIATGAKLALVLHRRGLPWLLVLLTLGGVGVMHWPLVAVVAVLAPLAILAAWKGRY